MHVSNLPLRSDPFSHMPRSMYEPILGCCPNALELQGHRWPKQSDDIVPITLLRILWRSEIYLCMDSLWVVYPQWSPPHLIYQVDTQDRTLMHTNQCLSSMGLYLNHIFSSPVLTVPRACRLWPCWGPVLALEDFFIIPHSLLHFQIHVNSRNCMTPEPHSSNHLQCYWYYVVSSKN